MDRPQHTTQAAHSNLERADQHANAIRFPDITALAVTRHTDRDLLHSQDPITTRACVHGDVLESDL